MEYTTFDIDEPTIACRQRRKLWSNSRQVEAEGSKMELSPRAQRWKQLNIRAIVTDPTRDFKLHYYQISCFFVGSAMLQRS